jgi:hypothetical protein
MNTTETNAGTDPLAQTDLESAWRHFEEGRPFDPDLARRIRGRAEEATREIARRLGHLDIDQLLRDDEP